MPKLILAPIRGVTDSIFRTALAERFPGLDGAVAPFVRTGRDSRVERAFADVALPRNPRLAVVPQLLGNSPAEFVEACQRLADMGHTAVDWNLGCPYPMAVKRGVGAALLGRPDDVCRFLDDALPRIGLALSIKARTGMAKHGELATWIDRLDAYPLAWISIHPRTAAMMYDGEADVSAFEAAAARTRHEVVYSGDIRTKADFVGLAARLPRTKTWMLGRGAIADPFLAAAIEGAAAPAPQERLAALAAFHADLLERYQERLQGPGHLIDRMLGIWEHFQHAFVGSPKLWKKLRKVRELPAYIEVVAAIFDVSRERGAVEM